MTRRAALPGGILAVALLASSCGGGLGAGSEDGATRVTVTVSAASSLTGAFTEIATAFERQNPGVAVRVNLGGSSALAEQINAGAPVDVFASASASTMATVVAAGNAVNPTTFARNSLAVVTPPANPAGITSLSDLARPGVTVAVCAPQVPCGSAAASLLDRAGIRVTPATLDPDVKAVLSRVTSDEVDAGIVYVTDARAAGAEAHTVEIPTSENVSTDYLIAVVEGSDQVDWARSFVDFVTGPGARATLTTAGFESP
ncbi:MAG: molybdate ABC transporter substrate-binding protein [Actinobacteria bacterium]|jgi:molybdate transport system substrate-binding protein|nr:molybdate ABC transporter substrate-binding protein [Actinomycetota bacterium]